MSQPSVIMTLETNTFVVAFEFSRYMLEKYLCDKSYGQIVSRYLNSSIFISP